MTLVIPKPMKAQDLSTDVDLAAVDLGLEKFFSCPDPDKYAMEPKLDGCRIVILLSETGNRVLSRGRDVSDHFPHLRDAVIEGAEGILLDGELLAEGPNGGILSAATSLLNAKTEGAVTRQVRYGPAWFVVFDILSAGSVSSDNVLRLSYDERRKLLTILIAQLEDAALLAADEHFGAAPHVPIQLVPSYPALAEHLNKFRDGEGFMIKDRRGKYIPGGRDGSGWWKFKWLSTADGFISGWKPGENSLSGMVGSVTLSLCAGNINDSSFQVIDVAKVGVFSNDFRRQLTAPDGSLKKEYLGQVMEFACQGVGTKGMARHPRMIRMRSDKSWTECGVEQLRSIPRV